MTFISNYVYHVSDCGAWSSHVSLDKKHPAFMPHLFLQDRTRYLYGCSSLNIYFLLGCYSTSYSYLSRNLVAKSDVFD